MCYFMHGLLLDYCMLSGTSLVWDRIVSCYVLCDVIGLLFWERMSTPTQFCGSLHVPGINMLSVIDYFGADGYAYPVCLIVLERMGTPTQCVDLIDCMHVSLYMLVSAVLLCMFYNHSNLLKLF